MQLYATTYTDENDKASDAIWDAPLVHRTLEAARAAAEAEYSDWLQALREDEPEAADDETPTLVWNQQNHTSWYATYSSMHVVVQLVELDD